jgi:hypothetical protein
MPMVFVNVGGSVVGGFDGAQIGFVDEGRGVQGVAGRFFGHPGGRPFAQFLVHQRQQLPSGLGVAVCQVGQDLGDFVHRSPECASVVRKAAPVIFWPVWEW